MHPILFTIGSWQVRSSYFFLAMAVLVGILFASPRARRLGLSKWDVASFWLAVVPFALLVGLLNSFLFQTGYLGRLEDISSLFSEGLVSFGIILAALFLGWALATLRKQPVGPVLDVISLVLPLILAVYRIGCLLNGCCFGRLTDGPLGMYLPGQAGQWAYRYPTQVMLILFDLALFGGLWLVQHRKPPAGRLTLAFLLAFSAGRLLIDAFRDLPSVLGPLNLHQLTALAILLVTLYVCMERWLARRRRANR